jgi:four helix bundle protein
VKHQQLCDRTLAFALSCARLARTFMNDLTGRHAASQLVRCATSVGANYRAAGLARSRREFIAKLGVVIEEADECVFWLTCLADLFPSGLPDLAPAKDEAQHLLRIFVASRTTARRNTPATPVSR